MKLTKDGKIRIVENNPQLVEVLKSMGYKEETEKQEKQPKKKAK